MRLFIDEGQICEQWIIAFYANHRTAVDTAIPRSMHDHVFHH